jgi:hypothetical protein
MKRCTKCRKRKPSAEFHPEPLLWGALCLLCYASQPGMGGS